MPNISDKVEVNDALQRSYFLQKWKSEQIAHLRLKYGDIDEKKIEKNLNKIIKDRLYNPFALLENNYLDKVANTDLLAIIDLIASQKPIIGGNGVLFYQHSAKDNPMLRWIKKIMSGRKIAKKTRDTYQKGTEEWAMYDTQQLILKITINSLDKYKEVA